MTTTWKFIPISAGPHVVVRVFAGVDVAHLVCVGEVEVRREDYGDLVSRFSPEDAFDKQSGQPMPITSSRPGSSSMQTEWVAAHLTDPFELGEQTQALNPPVIPARWEPPSLSGPTWPNPAHRSDDEPWTWAISSRDEPGDR